MAIHFWTHMLSWCLLFLFSVPGNAALHGRLPATTGGTDYQAYYDDQLDVTWSVEGNWARAQHLSDDGVYDGELSWTTAVPALAAFSINGVSGWRLPSVDVNGDGEIMDCAPATTTQATCKDNEIAHFYFYGSGDQKRVTGINGGNPGPFNDLQNDYYWANADCALNANCRYAFALYGFNGGLIIGNPANDHHILAVYSGDVDAPPPVKEICDNGIDDDGDKLVDGNDPDCAVPPVLGLLVRCSHEPLYPQPGEQVTIIGRAVDMEGNVISPDLAEIFIDDLSTPYHTANNQAGLIRFDAPNFSFRYGCRVTEGSETAQSWNLAAPVLREVFVGDVLNPAAVPVFINGPVSEKIDIVFFHDDDEYASYSDPAFLDDVADLLYEGLFTIPWFIEHQWAFNIWLAKADMADASPGAGGRCNRTGPDNLDIDYAFRDAAGIVHQGICQDNASRSDKLFTIETDPERLQVLAHEMGHTPFGLADEYCVYQGFADRNWCSGGHFTSRVLTSKGNFSPPYPNLFTTEDTCRQEAANRVYTPDNCRQFVENEKGFGQETWWIGEPEYRADRANARNIDHLQQVRDLMQQTGAIIDSNGIEVDRYRVGDSEIDRMNWLISRCLAGGC